MTRLADALMTDTAFAKGKSPMSNLVHGGLYGWAPNLTELASSTHHVRRNAICFLIEAPKAFALVPGGDVYTACLKAILELHAKTFDGFDAALEVESTETAAGLGGEKFHDISNVTRAVSNPSFTFTDLYGRPIQNFLHDWITIFGMDPITKVPGIVTLGINPTDWLNDMSTATILAFEMDPLHKKVVKAFLTTNLFPKGTGEIPLKKDKESEGELSELTIAFTGTTQVGAGVVALAQKLFDTVNMTNANPYLAAAFAQEIAADVKKQTSGFAQGVADLSNTTVNRV